ncbi:MAG: PDZ domain-containing protein [Planctomycetaceae bacterium]|nr:PDZ domain-containing protein [Planctomycetaceae bacterium]
MTCIDRFVACLCATMILCGFSNGILRAQDTVIKEIPPVSDNTLLNGKPDRTLLDGKPDRALRQSRPAFASEYWLGMQCSPAVPPMLQAHLNLKEGEGVMVEWVVPDSPAAKGGVEQYDVILKLDDTAVANVGEIVKKVDEMKDRPITVTVIHRGKTTELKLTPEKRPNEINAMPPSQQNETFRSVHPGIIFEGQDVPEEFQKMIEQMQKQMQQQMQQMPRDKSSGRIFALPPLESQGFGAQGFEFVGENTLQVNIEPGDDGKPGTLTVRKNGQTWSVEKFADLPENVQKDVVEVLKSTVQDKNTGDWIAEQMAEGHRFSVSVSVMKDDAAESSTDQKKTESPAEH